MPRGHHFVAAPKERSVAMPRLHALALKMIQMHAGHDTASMLDKDSLFNHHLAGTLVILLGVFAYLEQSELSRQRWVKLLWPLPLLALGTYLMLWSDNPQLRPFEFSSWMPSRNSLQHKIFALFEILLGLIELLRRTGHLKHIAWRQLLNGLILGAGIFLFFHRDHHSHVVHVEHFWMAVVAVTTALVKILTDYQNRTSWLSLYVMPALFVALGLQLALYVE
jgi:hypothetical protein